jgi:hypothetical protein
MVFQRHPPKAVRTAENCYRGKVTPDGARCGNSSARNSDTTKLFDRDLGRLTHNIALSRIDDRAGSLTRREESPRNTYDGFVVFCAVAAASTLIKMELGAAFRQRNALKLQLLVESRNYSRQTVRHRILCSAHMRFRRRDHLTRCAETISSL